MDTICKVDRQVRSRLDHSRDNAPAVSGRTVGMPHKYASFAAPAVCAVLPRRSSKET